MATYFWGSLGTVVVVIAVVPVVSPGASDGSVTGTVSSGVVLWAREHSTSPTQWSSAMAMLNALRTSTAPTVPAATRRRGSLRTAAIIARKLPVRMGVSTKR